MAVTETSSTTPTASERPRGAARREALLEAVLAIVAETGVEAVTHRRVAETAGLPLASTTYWFDSKDHLVCAALALAAERDIERLGAYVLPEDGTELAPDAALDQAVSAIGDSFAADDSARRASVIAGFALLLEAARRPALRATSRRWTAAYTETLGALLAAAGSRHPEDDAGLLMAAADGLLIESLASGEPVDLRRRMRRLAAALVEA